MKKSPLTLGVLGLVTCMLSGCGQESGPAGDGLSDMPSVVEPGALSFAISNAVIEKAERGETLTCLATRAKGGEDCRFGIEILLPTPSADSLFSFGKGAFIRQRNSVSSLLLTDLVEALQARGPAELEHTGTVERLEFTVAILGRGPSKQAGNDVVAGGFTTKPKGDWLAAKVFLADGEGEVYLNINLKEEVGEFSIKDPECGDIVIGELSRVL